MGNALMVWIQGVAKNGLFMKDQKWWFAMYAA